MKKIYLDNQSTTPIDPVVLDAMMPYLIEKYGNPSSSTHSFGWEAKEGVEIAREQVAKLINAKTDEIIFTSGATESINLALKGLASKQKHKKHIITFKTEHKAVLDVCAYLEKCNFDVSYVSVQNNGKIDFNKLETEIRDDTFLISMLHANNEIGTIHSLEEISKLCIKNNLFFHVDAAQSLGKIPIDLKRVNVDLLSISAHKIYAPKGCGALYINKNSKFKLHALLHGGGHEKGVRSGTVAVPNIAGFGKACELSHQLMTKEQNKIMSLRNKLLYKLKSAIPSLIVNGSIDNRLAGNLNVCFPNSKNQSIIMHIRDIALSSGSACTSANINPSHVLRAIGLTKKQSLSSIRFGIGRFNTEEEIDYTVKKIVDIINK